MTFNPSIPGVDSTQLQYMKLIDLNDYYRDIPGQEITHCQICNTSIAKNDVFEHSISKRHKYNKLLFGIAQDRSQNLDADFIVLNIDRLQCRYCNSLKINSDDDDLINNHIQDIEHIRKRQDSIDRDTTSAVNSSPLLKPLDTLITYANDSKKLSKKSDKRVEVVERLLEESKQSKNALKNMNNFDENSTLHCSGSSRDYESEEKIPKGSIIGDDGPCFCSFCFLSLAKGIDFVGVHPNCTKNRRPMIPVMKSIDQISKPRLFISEVLQTLLAKPLLSESRTTGEEALSNEETDSTDQNSSPALDKKISQNGIELPDYISIDENDTVTCNLCVTMIPKGYQNIDLHVDGKKHKQAIEVERSLIPDFISAVKKCMRNCTICLINIANNSSSIGSHIDSEQHKKAALQLLKSTNRDLEDKVSIAKKPLSKSGLPAFITIQENGICRCTLCLTGQALQSSNDIDQHVNSKKHKEAMKIQFKLPDCVSSVKDGIRCCTICNIKIPNVHSCIINHIMTSKAHKAAMQLTQSTSKELVTKAENMTTIRTANNIDQHSPPQCSATSSNKKLQGGIALPSCVTIGKNGVYKCTLCGIEVPRTSVNITDHLNGKKHKQKVTEINESKHKKLKVTEIKTALPVSVLSAAMPALPSTSKKLEIKGVAPDSREPELTNEPASEPGQISNSRKTEEITTAIEATNNIDQRSLPQCSVASSDEKLQSGIALPSCVTIGKNGAYKCRLCGIEAPRSSISITEHLNGKKHKQKVIEIIESKLQELKLEEIKTSLPMSVLSGTMPALSGTSKKLEIKGVMPDSREPEITNEPTPEPVQLTNSRETEGITTAIKSTNNIDQRSLPQCSAASSDEKLQSRIALPSCFTIGENGAYKCTPCGTEAPKTFIGIAEHLNGKKHKRKVMEINESKLQKLKLEEIETSLPMSVLSGTMPALSGTGKKLEIKGVMPDSRELEVTNEPMPESVKISNSRKAEEITTSIEETNNIDQRSLPQCSAASSGEKLQSGLALPSCFTIGENGAYKCTPCGTEAPKTSIGITEHLNGKKHKRKVMEINESKLHKLKLTEIKTSLPVSVLSAAMPGLPSTSKKLEIKGVLPHSREPEVTNEPTPEPVQPMNFRKTEEFTTAMKATDNIDQRSLPQLPSGTELPSCFSIGENGRYKCRPCGIKISGISITDHINDEKHKERIMEMNAAECQKSKLKEKEISSPVSVLPAEIPALSRTVNTDTYMCITCLISMPNDKVIIKEHNECPMHKQKNQDLKIDVLNTVYLNGNNSSNYICLIDHHIVCKLCRIFLPEHSLITDHVNSKEHRDNIPETSEPSSSSNAGNLKTDVLSKHVDSGLVYIFEIDDVRACKICHRVISTLPDVHVRTKKHQAMMQKVDKRLIGYEEVEKLLVCKICEKIYPKSKEFTHIYSDKHIRKTEALH